jgi:hypothetical protein
MQTLDKRYHGYLRPMSNGTLPVDVEVYYSSLAGNSDQLLSRSSNFMFMAANSAAKYLNTYGMATVSIPLLVLQAWHAKFF